MASKQKRDKKGRFVKGNTENDERIKFGVYETENGVPNDMRVPSIMAFAAMILLLSFLLGIIYMAYIVIKN